MTEHEAKARLRDKFAKLSREDQIRLRQAYALRREGTGAGAGTGTGTPARERRTRRASSRMDFSLFFFSSEGTRNEPDKYRLLLESAEIADASAIKAVWVPERHFVEFGGLFPNPSVLAAALAARTSTLGIRAGSVVLPLHHPVRVAEEWAVVDNLSGGRVGIAFASGWHQKDFQIAPGGKASHAGRKDTMLRNLDVVRRLWRGEAVSFEDASEPLTVYPRPLQRNVPIWLASQGTEDTFVAAGKAGAGILTGLVAQTREDLKRKIELYRDAARRSSTSGDNGHVVAMVHTFVGEEDDAVKAAVRAPLIAYLESFLSQSKGGSGRFSGLTEADRKVIVENTFERYFETTVLMGAAATCDSMVEDMVDMGIDEIACLIDFGLPVDDVLAGLSHLKALAERYSGPARQMSS
jgi:natural product biosynthesis luciferase-like monooxygenase protein